MKMMKKKPFGGLILPLSQQSSFILKMKKPFWCCLSFELCHRKASVPTSMSAWRQKRPVGSNGSVSAQLWVPSWRRRQRRPRSKEASSLLSWIWMHKPSTTLKAVHCGSASRWLLSLWRAAARGAPGGLRRPLDCTERSRARTEDRREREPALPLNPAAAFVRSWREASARSWPFGRLPPRHVRPFLPKNSNVNGRRSPSWREHRRQLFNHKRRLSEFTGVKSSCLNVQQVPAHNSPAADAKTKPLVCHRTVSGSSHMYKYSFPDVFHCAMGRRPGPPSSHSVWDRLQQLLEGI